MQPEWAPYPPDPNYLISDYGDVYSLYKNKLLTPTQVEEYLKLEVSGKIKFIHVLVAESHIGPRPPGKVVRHLDGDSFNNFKMNLIWGTHEQNVQDSRDHGTFRKLKGEECRQSKFSNSQADSIREEYAQGGLSQAALGRKYGVQQATICRIINRKSYRS